MAALASATFAAPATFAGSALDQYSESIPDPTGDHKPTSGPGSEPATGDGRVSDGSASGDVGTAGAPTDTEGGSDDATGTGSAAGGKDSSEPAQSGDDDLKVDRNGNPVGGARQAGVDSPPVSPWMIGALGVALAIAAVRGMAALRSRGRAGA